MYIEYILLSYIFILYHNFDLVDDSFYLNFHELYSFFEFHLYTTNPPKHIYFSVILFDILKYFTVPACVHLLIFPQEKTDRAWLKYLYIS